MILEREVPLRTKDTGIFASISRLKNWGPSAMPVGHLTTGLRFRTILVDINMEDFNNTYMAKWIELLFTRLIYPDRSHITIMVNP